MRYITHIPNLILYKDNGGVAHAWDKSVSPYLPMKKEYRFGLNGTLVVGDLSTNLGTGNAIDASANSYYPTEKLQWIYDTDLNGGTTTYIERAGQGTLDGHAASGDLSTLSWGYRGIFFEAPILDSPYTGDLVVGATYEVRSGTVTYEGYDYTQTDSFVASLATGTLGTGEFALTLPAELENANCDAFRSSNFRITSLQVGDESNDYWAWNKGAYYGGFEEKDSLVSADENYFGWTR